MSRKYVTIMIVEYKCNKCKSFWEEKFKLNNQCPHCKSDDVEEVRRRWE